MAIRNIRQNGDEALRKKCKVVTEITPRTLKLIEDMADTMYEDDGTSNDYKEDKNTTTKITSEVKGESVKVTVNKAEGKGYEGMVANRGTEVIINTRKAPEKVTVKVGGKDVELTPVTSEEAYNNGENV